MRHSTSRLTHFSILIILLFCIGRILYSGKLWNEGIIESDARGYCAYLPATFVLGDPLLKGYESLDWDERARFWVYRAPNEQGGWYPKFTMGLSIIIAPFYLMAHVLSMLFGWEANGWSAPYQWSVAISGLTMLALGLFALAAWLRRYFRDSVVAITISLSFWATNLVLYSTDAIAMSHVYSFSLLAIAVWAAHECSDRKRLAHILILSVCAALITLIRPTNAVLLIVPVYIIIHHLPKEDRVLMRLWRLDTLSAIVIFIILLLPQLLYWKLLSGQWVFYTYGDERMFLGNPNIWEGLFSYRNGWMLYTPIAIFVFPGLLLFGREQRVMARVAAVAFLLHIYLVFSWWCWYYGGSWSIRTMVDAYLIAALGLAAVVHWLLLQKKWKIFLGAAVAIFLVANNLIQYNHHLSGALHYSDMTEKVFWKLFMNPFHKGDMHLLGYYRAPDTERLMKGEEERSERDTIEMANSIHLEVTWKHDEEVYAMEEGFGPSLKIPISRLKPYVGKMLEVEFPVFYTESNGKGVVAVVETEGFYRSIPFPAASLNDDGWDTLRLYIPIPSLEMSEDELKCYIWLPRKGRIEGRKISARVIDIVYSETQ